LIDKEICKKVAKDLNIPVVVVEKTISSTFNQIKSLIIKKQNILLRGFFKFVTSKRKTYKKPDKLKIEQIIKLPTKK
jgi:nucleoid DNA-binding protein